MQLPDVLLTKSNVSQPSFAKYAYIPDQAPARLSSTRQTPNTE